MNALKTALITVLILSFINLGFPYRVLAQQEIQLAREHITVNPPMISTTPETDIPAETQVRKVNKWVWIGISVLAVACISAAVEGLRSEDDDDDDDNIVQIPASTNSDTGTGAGTDTEDNTGNLTVRW